MAHRPRLGPCALRSPGGDALMSKLATHGGTPVRTTPFPSVGDASGRTVGPEEEALVREVLSSGRLNRGAGPKVAELESCFAEYMGVPHCVASTSGTAAIHVALGAVNPEPGDEIITGPVTDMGTVIPILLQNAIPVFADLERSRLGLDPADVERRITDRTRAIIPVHLMGIPTDMAPIVELARKHGLAVIEDCSQAYGTLYRGKPVGTWGDMGTFSLQQSKHITCGDGGMTITRDGHLGDRGALFANKGWPNYGTGGRDYVCFGVNYRMTELQAAVTLAQVAKLPRIVDRRVELGTSITRALADLPGLYIPPVAEGDRHTYWYLAILVDQQALGVTTSVLAEAIAKEGIPCGAHYIGKPIFLYDLLRSKRIYGTSDYPFCLQPADRAVRYEPGETPETERILDDLILVPINENMTDRDRDDIVEGIRKVMAHIEELHG